MLILARFDSSNPMCSFAQFQLLDGTMLKGTFPVMRKGSHES